MSKAVWRTGLALGGTFLALFAVLFVFLGSVSASAVNPGEIAPTDSVSEADVVVDFGDGLVVARHITFTGSITSVAALRLAGWEVTLGSSGELAAIEDVGCPASDPFCRCPAPYDPCLFWEYSHLDGDEWPVTWDAPSTYVVQDGDVEGYAWGGRTPRPALSTSIMAAHSALQWLGTQQQDDGGYGNVGSTLNTILAVAAAGEDVEAWRSDADNSMIDYLRAGVSPYTYTTSYIGQAAQNAGTLALALAAADLDPTDFEGLDLVDVLSDYYDPATGAFDTTYGWWQAIAMMGWQASGETIPVTATNYLKSLVNTDGGWGFPGYGSDPDTTGMVLQGLIAAGEPLASTAVVSGVAYLADAQDEAGGFVSFATLNVNSTAVAIPGLLAAGEDPLGAAWTTAISNSHPISYLLEMQSVDGSFPWKDKGGASDILATQQAVWALLGKPFPYPSKAVTLRKAVDWIAAQQQADGGFGDASKTLDAIFALRAAGVDPQDFVKNNNTPLDYLETQAATYATSAATTGKLIVGVAAARGNPWNFSGEDLVADLLTYYQPITGSFGTGSTTDQAWAILGLAAVNETIPVSATDYLDSIRFTTDKAWGWTYPGGSAWCTEADADSTGLALQALAAAGVEPYTKPVMEGLAFLRGTVQNADGLFGYEAAYPSSNMNSTGMALQGLAAYAHTPRGLGWTRVATDTGSLLTLYNPLAEAMGYQSAAGGFPYIAGLADDALATYQVVPGIAGVALPFRISYVYLPVVMRAS